MFSINFYRNWIIYMLRIKRKSSKYTIVYNSLFELFLMFHPIISKVLILK